MANITDTATQHYVYFTNPQTLVNVESTEVYIIWLYNSDVYYQTDVRKSNSFTH